MCVGKKNGCLVLSRPKFSAYARLMLSSWTLWSSINLFTAGELHVVRYSSFFACPPMRWQDLIDIGGAVARELHTNLHRQHCTLAS